jgi:hypothetical protein
MARHHMSFPRYIDRPGLILMFEADEVIYSVSVAAGFAVFIMFATASNFYALLVFLFLLPLVKSVVSEIKKSSALPGGLQYIQYASGYFPNFPMKKEKLLIRWPELKRMDHLDFVPFGFEDEFYS